MRAGADFSEVFCEDAPEYHIIVAGSLLGVAVNRSEFSFPVGKVDIRTLYPMDMEEFMIAMGQEELAANDILYIVEELNDFKGAWWKIMRTLSVWQGAARHTIGNQNGAQT